MGFRDAVWELGFGFWGHGFGVSSLELVIWNFDFEVEDLRFGVIVRVK